MRNLQHFGIRVSGLAICGQDEPKYGGHPWRIGLRFDFVLRFQPLAHTLKDVVT